MYDIQPHDPCWRRPDLKDGRDVPRQKDLVELFRPDGRQYGLMEVDNYPLIAVTRSMYLTENGFEQRLKVANVPAALGIHCAEGQGGFDWITHDCCSPVTNGSCTLVNLYSPNDGFGHIFHDHTDLLSRHVFMDYTFVQEKAELFPDQLGAVNRMIEDFNGDAFLDMRHLTASPACQNAIAAIFAQPVLGNTAEEYVSDNIITLLSVFSERTRPASLDKIAYDSTLRAKVLAARDIIQSDLQSPLSLRSLALSVGTNENYLKAGFKHEFGTTVFGYLFECRMQAARRLLLDPNLPIDQVALAVGYNDPYSFYRPFRRRFGVTPTQYRMSIHYEARFSPV